LERRMKDSTGLANLKAIIKVIDFNTGNPIPGCIVSNFEDQKLTDNLGSATFEKLSNILKVNIKKDFYETISSEQFTIFSDTILTFYLLPEKYKVTLTVSDIQTGDFFLGTRVTFNNEVQITNEQGEAYFEAYPGKYNYLVEKNSYLNESGNVELNSDTTYKVLMTRLNGSVKIKIFEGINTPVNNATVILNTDTLISTSLGISNFKNLPVDMPYNYFIYKGGYDDLSGSLYLNNDTTVILQMEPYTTSINKKSELNEINLWPNPASEFLNVTIPNGVEQGVIEIIDLKGTSLKKFYPGKERQIELPIQEISAGIYFLKLISKHKSINQVFIKN